MILENCSKYPGTLPRSNTWQSPSSQIIFEPLAKPDEVLYRKLGIFPLVSVFSELLLSPPPTLFIIGLLPRSLIILHHPQSTALCNKLPPSKPIFSQLASFAPPLWPFPAQIHYLPALLSTTSFANNQLD